jgi:hypothetical protein
LTQCTTQSAHSFSGSAGKCTGEIPAPEFLVAPLAPYAKLTEQHIAKLRADREYDLGVDRACGEALARKKGSG